MCPACQLSFNLNAPGLASMDGMVRCGACLTVFRARDHLTQTAAHSQNSIDRSVFVTEELLDYFSPQDFLSIERSRDTNQEKNGYVNKKE